MRASLTVALLACTAPFVAHAASVETGGPLTDAQAIASAESAAPAAVAKDAEIVTFDAQGNMRPFARAPTAIPACRIPQNHPDPIRCAWTRAAWRGRWHG